VRACVTRHTDPLINPVCIGLHALHTGCDGGAAGKAHADDAAAGGFARACVRAGGRAGWIVDGRCMAWCVCAWPLAHAWALARRADSMC
jgi:hypothetical protein